MADIKHPAIPSAIADEPQGAAMEPQAEAEAVKDITREVDANDMFADDSDQQVPV